MLTDWTGRQIDYLRLSVTDHCNLRCQYCMPLEWGAATRTTPPYPPPGPLRTGEAGSLRQNILTFEEIERMVGLFVGLGIRRVRLTGGEPLVRKGITDLVDRLSAIEGLDEVLLTTNGVLLAPLAKGLLESGVRKVNVHLDTLSPTKFARITRWGDIRKVLEGIRAAQEIGMERIKLNMVLQRGINDDEVEAMMVFCAKNQLILRLIELMPIGPVRGGDFRMIPMEEVLAKLSRKYTLHSFGARLGSGPAVYYKVAELDSVVGLISPVSRPFCETCNRIRISSDGRLQDCLAYEGTSSLRDLLRTPGLSDQEIVRAIGGAVLRKRGGHDGFGLEEMAKTPCMYGIGG